MRRPVIAVVFLALMTASQNVAGVRLVLLDGQRIAGQELERHENEFILETAQGARVVVPRQLVAAIHLTGERSGPSVAVPASSLTPTPAEQLAAFGRDPAMFQRPPVDATWRYEDVLGYETDVTQFRPSHWYRSKVDPNWRYEDVLGSRTDVTQFAPAQWPPAPVPPRWYPADAWSPGLDAGQRD